MGDERSPLTVEIAENATHVETAFRPCLPSPPRVDRFRRLDEMVDNGLVVAEFRPLRADAVDPLGEDLVVLRHQSRRERCVAEVPETDPVGVTVGDGRGVVETGFQIEVRRR